MRRAGLAVLLWWFLWFDPEIERLVAEGGHYAQALCEAQAISYGYLVRLESSRPVYEDGKLTGRWQRACFEGPASMRTTIVRTR